MWADKGTRRELPADLLLLIEGLALSKPRHRVRDHVCEIAQREG